MKPYDWAAIFEDLQEMLSDQEVERRTGVKLRTIKKIQKGTFNTNDWDISIQIIDTYLKTLEVAPPKIGGYNIYIKEDEVA
jgi:hypothetical protein